MFFEIVMSGGQTGADQGGILAAFDCGVPTGGTAPAGWRTLTGPAPWLQNYGLVEHESREYPPRTECNVRETDGTLRYAVNFKTPGERCTKKFILAYKKPSFDVLWKGTTLQDKFQGVVGVGKYKGTPEEVAEWIIKKNIQRLNIAGNSEQNAPGICEFVIWHLTQVIRIVEKKGCNES